MTDLRAYLDQIKKLNELSFVKKKVSTKYEIAAVTSKIDCGNAILFENIKEYDIHQKVISAIERAKKPKITSKAKFMENRSKDLSILPIVTHFEKEPGPFITSSIIYTQNQETRTQNSSFHRLMPLDKIHFSVRMVEGRHLHRTFMYAK